jgi:SAM-dependent methyltransferase
MLKTDFGAVASDYARHRAGFPDSLFERLATFGIGVPGQSLLDLGTGTGALARGFAVRGCRVTAIDIAEPLLEEARRLDAEAGVAIDYRVARAEDAGFGAHTFDVVTAGQCWHWFDRAAAAREVARLLVPDGFAVIAHFDWIAMRGNVVEATEKLIEAHNPRWRFGGGTGIYPRWLRDLSEAGFRDVEAFSYDLDVAYTHEAWRGRIRASSGIGANLPPAEVAVFDRAHEALLAARFPLPLLNVPHRVFAVVGRSPLRA